MKATAPAETLDLEVLRDALTSVRRLPPSIRSQSSASSPREEREQPAGRGSLRAAVTAGAGGIWGKIRDKGAIDDDITADLKSAVGDFKTSYR